MIEPEERKFARDFINDRCIVRVRAGSRRFPAFNGKGINFYRWQFYPRAALLHPFILYVAVRDFLDRYEDYVKDGKVQLCGVEAASSPLLTGIGIECYRRGYPVPTFLIRKERKPYGLMNWIEGIYYRDRPAMMVDDVISETHKTAFHAMNILRDHDIEIADRAYCFIHKTHDAEKNINLWGQQITGHSLFNLNDFDLLLEDYEKAKSEGGQEEQQAAAE